MKRTNHFLLLCAGLLVFASTASNAQALNIELGPKTAPFLTVEAEFVGFCKRAGSYAYVTAEVVNHTPVSKKIALMVQYYDNEKTDDRTSQSLTLAPQEHVAVVLPWLCTNENKPMLAVELDEGGLLGAARYREIEPFSSVSPLSSHTAEVLLLSNKAKEDLWDAALETIELSPLSVGPHKASTPTHISVAVTKQAPERLPPQWFLLSGFELILADASSPGWNESNTKLLQDYTKAGGHVLWLHADQLPHHLLRSWQSHAQTSATDASSHQGAWGMGSFLMVMHTEGILQKDDGLFWDDTQGVVIQDWVAALMHTPPSDPRHPLYKMHRQVGEPVVFYREKTPVDHLVPAAWFHVLPLAGLKQISIITFVVILFVFGFLAGPVNYWYWYRRRKQPAMVLVTLPLMGVLFTGVILGYGLWTEGLRVRGSVASLTWIDQHAKEAVTVSARTLYASRSPAQVLPHSQTYLSPVESIEWMLTEHRGTNPYKWDLRLAPNMQIDGAAIPSRTPSSLVATTVDVARERLEFRRESNDTLTVLSNATWTPLNAANSLLVRDFAGHYYTGEGSSLRLLPEADVLATLAVWGKRGPSVRSRAFWQQWTDDEQALPKGAYLMRMATNPLVDDLGLTPAYDTQEHLVCGTLALEDIHDR